MERYIGLDLGSSYTKIVELEGNEIVRHAIVKTSKNREIIPDLNVNLCTTGYFRKQVRSAYSITEITAAILGARHYFPDAEVVVDIGGQDIKVIDVRENRFYINDKCSAGTGAFFEFILSYLGLDFDALNAITEGKLIFLNNTCTVFALSEIISHLANGAKLEDVITGLNYSFARKVAEMVPECKNVVLVGGVAKNRGFARALSSMLNASLLLPPEPQLINALGAALYVKEKVSP